MFVNGRAEFHSGSTGNFMSCGSRGNLSWRAQGDREMESNSTNLVNCVVQSDYPETLDGSFLTLGVGANTEDRSKYNANRDFIGTIDGAIHSQFNPSHGQSGYGSSFSHDLKKGAYLSDFQTCAGGFSGMEENTVRLSSPKQDFCGLSSVMQNAGESSNMCAFSDAMKNVDGCSLSDYDLGVARSTSSYSSLSPLQMLPKPQGHVPHPFLKPGDPLAALGSNKCFHDHSGVFSKVHSSSQSEVPPSQGFLSLSSLSPLPIEHSSSQYGMPVQGQLRMASQPSSYSCMTSKYSTLASNQLPKRNMRSIPSLQCGTSVSSPVLGNTESINSQYQSAYLGQSQHNTPVQASNNILASTYASGPVIPVPGEIRPFMTSNLRARPSLKKKATQTPPAIHQVQIKKKRSVKPSFYSSTLQKAQNSSSVAPLPLVVSQAATVPSLAQAISSVPPVTMTARSLPPLVHKVPSSSPLSQATPAYPPLQRTSPIPPSARMSPYSRIKWQDSKLLDLSGHNCFLCKRDLSYTPDGPVSQPAVPPPVAVLSCGHCFHDLCLQRITHEDQANDPPCIPCVVCEN